MDATRGLNEQDADKALRDLFHQAGPLSAPDGLEARVLQRIAVTARPALAPEKPLLPKWAWYAGGLGLLAVAFLPGNGTSSPSPWVEKIPDFSLENAISSPWLMMALATGALLIGLDTWLTTRRLAHQAR